MKKVYVIDIETLRNCFILCALDIRTQERLEFVIHEDVEGFEPLIEFLKYSMTMITFNGLDFDAQVLHWIYKNRKELRESDSIADQIYFYAQQVIELSSLNQLPEFSENELKWKQVDLYKIWHFNNRAKATSLKWVQYMIDWHDVREMPIHHTQCVGVIDIDGILSYCWNDVLSTYELFKITRGKTELAEYKGKDKIEFRQTIGKKINKDCINWNDVRIGDELNFIKYREEIDISKKDIKDSIVPKYEVYVGECIPEYIEFKTEPLKKLLEDVRGVTVRRDGLRFLEGEKTFKRTIKIGDTTHCMMLGGIHSEDSPRIIIPKTSQVLRDADVQGQYPSAIAKRELKPSHLDSVWLANVIDTIEERVRLKPLAKKDKSIAAVCEASKLQSNGGCYGKLGEENNWQHDYQTMFSVTIGCQFEILMLIEALEANNISVVSSNTDGIVSLFDAGLEHAYKGICGWWESKVLVSDKQYGKLEFCDYSKVVQMSVNDYIAIKYDGEVKKKGDFMTEFELHKNKSQRIIPLALEAYYSKGISPKRFVKEHDNVFDFCIGVKSRANFYYEARSIDEGEYTVEKLQKIVRYYISNSGVKLIKCNPDGRESQCVAGKWLSTVMNKYNEKKIEDYDINYDYYIQEVYSIINKIDPDVTVNYTQLSMF